MSTNITPGLYKCQIQIIDDDNGKTYPIIYTIDCMCIENESFDCISYDFFGAAIQPSSGYSAASIGFKEKKNNSNTTPRNGYIKVFNPKYASNDYFVQIDYFGAISSIKQSLIYQISDTANVKNKGFTATNLKNKKSNTKALCGSVFIINGLIYKDTFVNGATNDNNATTNLYKNVFNLPSGFYLCKLQISDNPNSANNITVCMKKITCVCFVNNSCDCVSFRFYGALVAYSYTNTRVSIDKYKYADGIIELFIDNSWKEIQCDIFYGLVNSSNTSSCALQYSDTDTIKTIRNKGKNGTVQKYAVGLYYNNNQTLTEAVFRGCTSIIGGMVLKTSNDIITETDQRFNITSVPTISTIDINQISKAQLFIINANNSNNTTLMIIDCCVLETSTFNNSTKLNVYTFFGADVALQKKDNFTTNASNEIYINKWNLDSFTLSDRLYGAQRPTFGMKVNGTTSGNQGNGYFKIYNEKYKNDNYVVQFDYIYAYEFYDRQYASQLAGYASGGNNNYKGVFTCNNNINQEQFRGIMPIFAAYKVVSS